jgi:hypothetical protein
MATKKAKKAAVEKKAPATKRETPKAKAAKPDAPDVVERARFTERLPVKIDQELRDKNGRELAGVIRRRRDVLEAKAIANQRFRGELKYFDERLDELADAVDQGVDLVDVVCVEHLVGGHTIQTTRTDTGEVMRSRPAESKDKQVDLFDGAKRKGVRPEKKPPSTVGELVAEAHAHADALAGGLTGEICDPAGVLAKDAGVDMPPPPRRRRGGKAAPRTEEDRRIAEIDRKNGNGEDSND